VVEEVIAALDRTSQREIDAGTEDLFARYGRESLVGAFVQAFPRMRHWEGRNAVLFWLIKFARKLPEVVELAKQALGDKAALVRMQACAALAFSLRDDALPALEGLASHRHMRTREWAEAAMDAIRHKNHHYFVDRGHTGRSFWAPDGGS